MGDRGEIHIKPQWEGSGVYLYSHWHGRNLKEYLANALAHEERWNDSSYLTRIIFEEMIEQHGSNKFTGFGIHTHHQGDARIVATVDVDEQVVITEDEEIPFEAFVERYK